MYRIVRVSLLAAIVLVLAVAGLQAQAPNTLMYQGKLTDATGPISTAVNVTFAIYDVASGGSALWSEPRSVTPDASGVFSIELGSSVAFPAGLFDGSARYLGITVGADDEMTPRQSIASAPYAMSVANAPGVTNYMRSTFWYYPGTGEHTVDSIDITIPNPGYVVVTAGCYPNCYVQSGVTQELWFLISQTFGDASFANPPVAVIRVPGESPGNWAMPVVVSRLYVESAGAHRYFFNTYFSGAGTPNLGQVYMRAEYYPRSYGSVIAPSSKEAPQTNSAGERVAE